MKTLTRLCHLPALVLTGLCLMGTAAMAEPAPSASGSPANSVSKPYGSGWACERGHAPKANACAKIVLPKFAHLNSSGDGWQCDRPYRQAGGACVAP